MLKASELVSMSVPELDKALEAQLKEQFNLRMQHATSQLNQSHKLGQVRKAIARIKTVLRQKQTGEQS